MENTDVFEDPTSGAGSPEAAELDMPIEGTMRETEVATAVEDPTSSADSPVVTELDMSVEGATQDMRMATTVEDPKTEARSPEITEPADRNRCSWLRKNKRPILVASLLVPIGLAGIGFTAAGIMHSNNESKEDPLHGYAMLPGHEVYRPKPSFVLNNTDLLRCAKKALTNNDTEVTSFQFCAPKGMELGRCELFINVTKLRTRLADNCDVYARGDPADLGIAHGGAAKIGVAVVLSLLSLSVVLHNAFVA